MIGASVSGKTTIARAIQHRHAYVEVFFFDQIGVPSEEQMIVEYGSGEGWQRAKTLEWMIKLARLNKSGSRLLFEGQTRLSFLAEGAPTDAVPCQARRRAKRRGCEYSRLRREREARARNETAPQLRRAIT